MGGLCRLSFESSDEQPVWSARRSRYSRRLGNSPRSLPGCRVRGWWREPVLTAGHLQVLLAPWPFSRLKRSRCTHVCPCLSVCAEGRRVDPSSSSSAQGYFWWQAATLGRARTLNTTNPLKITVINKHFKFSKYRRPLLSSRGPLFNPLLVEVHRVSLWKEPTPVSTTHPWAHTSSPWFQASTPSPARKERRPCEGLWSMTKYWKSQKPPKEGRTPGAGALLKHLPGRATGPGTRQAGVVQEAWPHGGSTACHRWVGSQEEWGSCTQEDPWVTIQDSPGPSPSVISSPRIS